jgi:hypothetical protein
MTKSTQGIIMYRATRDGFSSQAFHSKCDGKGIQLQLLRII